MLRVGTADVKLKDVWGDLDDGSKQPYMTRHQEATDAFNQKMGPFKAQNVDEKCASASRVLLACQRLFVSALLSFMRLGVTRCAAADPPRLAACWGAYSRALTPASPCCDLWSAAARWTVPRCTRCTRAVGNATNGRRRNVTPTSRPRRHTISTFSRKASDSRRRTSSPRRTGSRPSPPCVARPLRAACCHRLARGAEVDGR